MNCMFLPTNFILSIRRCALQEVNFLQKNIFLLLDLMGGCGVYSHFGFNPKEGRDSRHELLRWIGASIRRWKQKISSRVCIAASKTCALANVTNFTTTFRSVFFWGDRFWGRRKGNREVAPASLLQKSSLKPTDERSRVTDPHLGLLRSSDQDGMFVLNVLYKYKK